MLARAVRLVLAGLFWAPAALACDPHSSPIGWLVCADPSINALDSRAAVVFGDVTRMRVRFAELCEIPKGAPAGMTQPARWGAAACIYDNYVTALTVKGERVPKPSLPGGVHPLCMAAGLARRDDLLEDVPLEECHAGMAHIPFTVQDGWRTAEGMVDGTRAAFFSYRSIGALPSRETLIQAEEGTGGTGVFSTLALVGITKASPQQLMILGYRRFGDRCNRGLADARIVDGRIEYDLSLTSFDLFNLDDPIEYRTIHILEPDIRSKGLVSVRPYDDLERYANGPCLGTATFSMDLDTLEGTPLSVAINAPARGGEAVYQKCFEDFLTARFREFPVRIPVSDLPALAGEFKAKCLKGP